MILLTQNSKDLKPEVRSIGNPEDCNPNSTRTQLLLPDFIANSNTRESSRVTQNPIFNMTFGIEPKTNAYLHPFFLEKNVKENLQDF